MARFKYISGPFDCLYIGQFLASSTPLTQVGNPGTGGYKAAYRVPKAFVACTNSYVQSGSATINVKLSFISDDPYAFNLAMGNWFGDQPDKVPGGTQYSLLLWDSLNSGSSLFIPRCETETVWDLDRVKGEETKVDLEFKWQDANTADQLFKKKLTNALLLTALGSLAPPNLS